MIGTVDYILKRFDLSLDTHMPIEIPNFGRDQLAEMFSELAFRRGVEVGVAAGEYSQVLCSENPNAMIYGVDPYIPHEDYRDYKRNSTFARLEREAHERLDRYPNYKFIRAYSMDALKEFGDESLDFVYIDGNHNFVNVASDIHHWSKKLQKGGILAGHDYHRSASPDTHVFQVVNAYTEAYKIRPWFVLGTNAEVPGIIRDPVRSWMWVKV